MRLKKDLASETEDRLRTALDEEVARMNRRRRLGMVSDWQFGEYLAAEEKATRIGNEIRRRHGRPTIEQARARATE